MLVLNKEIFFVNEEILEEVIGYILGESYDENTRIGNKILTDHLREAFEADKRLTKMIQNRIGDDIVPIVLFEFCNWCDMNKFDFYLTSTDEDRKILKREELLFYEYCDICFGHIRGLMSKLNEALPD